MDFDKVTALTNSVSEADVSLNRARHVLKGILNDSFVYAPGFSAFGSTPAASSLSSLYRTVARAGNAAAGRLGTVLYEDVLRLKEVKRCFQKLDDEMADRICANASGQTLNIYSGHVHSSGSEAIDSDSMDDSTADDYVRAGQISELKRVFNERPGVIGGDFNVEADAGSRSAEALSGFEDDGHRIDSGRLNDSLGGTSASHMRIDYVITAPGIGAENPQRVDGGSSDHDGVRVDLTVPRW